MALSGANWTAGHNPWTVKATRTIHRNHWFDVEENAVVKPDGADGAYQVVRFHGVGVGILPIGANGFVHVIGQWRFPLGRYSWELPEGGQEADEDVLAAAKRELAEETGLSASTWIKALDLDLSTTLTDERACVFIAYGLKDGRTAPDDTEVLRHQKVHFTELVAAVFDGHIREAVSAAGILAAQHLAMRGRLPEVLVSAMLSAPSETP